MTDRTVTERRRALARARRGMRSDAGYGIVGYLVIGGLVVLILAGAVLLFMMITSSSTSTPTETTASSLPAGTCAADQWFDPKTATCVPKTVCAEGAEYIQLTNTCVIPPATVDAIAPASGLSTGGTEVRITGTGFEPDATVAIDGVPAIDVNVSSATTITAVTPPSKNRYPVDIEVVNPGADAAVLNNAFTYVTPAVPLATDVNPARGSTQGGEAVIIRGTGFVEGTRVAFGGRSATEVTVLNPSTLRVITPVGSAGKTTVNVRKPGEDVFVLEDAFTYARQAPRTIATVRPVKGPERGGTAITITGSAFDPQADVLVGGAAARKVKVVSSTRITAVTPPGTVGPADVAVRNPGLPAAILADGFEFVAAPTLKSVAPARGPEAGGTKVTLTGTGFLDGAKVTFAGAAATKVTVVSPTRITAVTPPGKAGAVTVIVDNPDQPASALKRGFTYQAGATEPGVAAGHRCPGAHRSRRTR